MGVPLVALAACSFLGLFIDLPFHPTWAFLERWLQPVVGASLAVHHFGVAELWGFGLADVAFAAPRHRDGGGGVAGGRQPAPSRAALSAHGVVRRLELRPLRRPPGCPRLLVRRVGRRGAGHRRGRRRVWRGSCAAAAERLRRVQSGYVRTYALAIVGGIVIVVAYLVTRAGS